MFVQFIMNKLVKIYIILLVLFRSRFFLFLSGMRTGAGLREMHKGRPAGSVGGAGGSGSGVGSSSPTVGVEMTYKQNLKKKSYVKSCATGVRLLRGRQTILGSQSPCAPRQSPGAAGMRVAGPQSGLGPCSLVLPARGECVGLAGSLRP